jgi:hypothetical protein
MPPLPGIATASATCGWPFVHGAQRNGPWSGDPRRYETGCGSQGDVVRSS